MLRVHSRHGDILADTSVVLLATKEAVYNYYRISLCAAFVVMEAVCEVNHPQAC
jgi:hypothetical protein